MISTLLADEEARATKESSKEASKALRELRAEHNVWRTQATVEKMAKYADNLAKWPSQYSKTKMINTTKV